MKLRSLLFAPADQPRKVTKALESSADAVVLDLEDAVGPGNKEVARQALASVLPVQGRDGVIVRINARGSQWYLDDLAAVVPGRPAAIMLPKCTGIADLVALDHHLEALEASAGLPHGGIGVLALVTETAGSLHHLDYRGAPARLRALCFGAEDLSAELNVLPRGEGGVYPAPVAHARAALLIAAAAAGLQVLDTPFPDPRDETGLMREIRHAVRDGFSGKLCIHPAQVEAVNTAFMPDEAQIAWARSVRAAFASAPDAGVISIEGKMVERMHLRMAERILALGA
ncbi:HpcH/HpaI aldolase/citrate lyase family protein [Acetobacteraceae bacterium AT-5844]|nr:HpcH/HpaI aldolase/citrate lyase family protein [Acetobacteraceae bacterium AT-5844]